MTDLIITAFLALCALEVYLVAVLVPEYRERAPRQSRTRRRLLDSLQNTQQEGDRMPAADLTQELKKLLHGQDSQEVSFTVGDLRGLLYYAVELAQYQGGGTAVERGQEAIKGYLDIEMKK
jgi:hypothetical protein